MCEYHELLQESLCYIATGGALGGNVLLAGGTTHGMLPVHMWPSTRADSALLHLHQDLKVETLRYPF